MNSLRRRPAVRKNREHDINEQSYGKTLSSAQQAE